MEDRRTEVSRAGMGRDCGGLAHERFYRWSLEAPIRPPRPRCAHRQDSFVAVDEAADVEAALPALASLAEPAAQPVLLGSLEVGDLETRVQR